jgi:hypothetical protein
LRRFLRIGLFAVLRWHYGPAATVVHKSAFSFGNSHFPQKCGSRHTQKAAFRMACSTRPILPGFASGKRQFGPF